MWPARGKQATKGVTGVYRAIKKWCHYRALDRSECSELTTIYDASYGEQKKLKPHCASMWLKKKDLAGSYVQ